MLTQYLHAEPGRIAQVPLKLSHTLHVHRHTVFPEHHELVLDGGVKNVGEHENVLVEIVVI